MPSAAFSRRSVVKAAALAGGTMALGLPQVLWPATAEAYTVPRKMDWWYQARFGMFIHFGSYSYLGHGEGAFYVEGWDKTEWCRRRRGGAGRTGPVERCGRHLQWARARVG